MSKIYLYVFSVIGFIVSCIGLEVWIIKKWLNTMREIRELKKQLKEDKEELKRLTK
jgi:hypothetical protein